MLINDARSWNAVHTASCEFQYEGAYRGMKLCQATRYAVEAGFLTCHRAVLVIQLVMLPWYSTSHAPSYQRTNELHCQYASFNVLLPRRKSYSRLKHEATIMDTGRIDTPRCQHGGPEGTSR
jgi:hypothetical protein